MVEQISGSRTDAHWPQPRPSSTETQYCIYNRVIYGFGDGDARVCPSNMEYTVQSLRKAYVTETHHGSTFITQSKDRKESVGSKPTGPPRHFTYKESSKRTKRIHRLPKMHLERKTGYLGQRLDQRKKEIPFDSSKKSLEQVYP